MLPDLMILENEATRGHGFKWADHWLLRILELNHEIKFESKIIKKSPRRTQKVSSSIPEISPSNAQFFHVAPSYKFLRALPNLVQTSRSRVWTPNSHSYPYSAGVLVYFLICPCHFTQFPTWAPISQVRFPRVLWTDTQIRTTWHASTMQSAV